MGSEAFLIPVFEGNTKNPLAKLDRNTRGLVSF